MLGLSLCSSKFLTYNFSPLKRTFKNVFGRQFHQPKVLWFLFSWGNHFFWRAVFQGTEFQMVVFSKYFTLFIYICLLTYLPVLERGWCPSPWSTPQIPVMAGPGTCSVSPKWVAEGSCFIQHCPRVCISRSQSCELNPGTALRDAVQIPEPPYFSCSLLLIRIQM